MGGGVKKLKVGLKPSKSMPYCLLTQSSVPSAKSLQALHVSSPEGRALSYLFFMEMERAVKQEA